MNEKRLREIINQIDERAVELGSSCDAKEEALSDILKLVEEETFELKDRVVVLTEELNDDIKFQKNFYLGRRIKELESELQSYKQVSEEMETAIEGLLEAMKEEWNEELDHPAIRKFCDAGKNALTNYKKLRSK